LPTSTKPVGFVLVIIIIITTY